MKRRIALLGAPATGKGTQAALLSAAFRIPTFSTGAAMREEVRKGTALGIEASHVIGHGGLFPDRLALQLVWSWIGEKTRFILDGFPRTLAQAVVFDQELARRALPLESVILLELPEPIIRERVLARLTCTACASVFQSGFHDLALGSPCPACSAPLARRPDDSEEALAIRLREYHQFTSLVADHYSLILLRVNASPGRDAVFHTLYNHIRQ